MPSCRDHSVFLLKKITYLLSSLLLQLVGFYFKIAMPYAAQLTGQRCAPPKVTRQSLYGPTQLFHSFPKVLPKLSPRCLKVVPKLRQSCVEVTSKMLKNVSKICQCCLKVVSKLSHVCDKVVSNLYKTRVRVVSKFFLKLSQSCL